MINGNTITFDGISPDRIPALKAALPGAGFTVTDKDSGWEVTGHGVTADVSYAPSTLTVEVTHKPFYASMGLIESKIQAALGS